MKVVALTGAGISKSAGIPTFLEVDGIKEKLSIEFKTNNTEEFNETLELLINNVKDKEPTKAHKALAELQIPIITMNVDGLHQKAGSKIVYELHGNYKQEIVLYGQDIFHRDDAIHLIIKTAVDAKANNEKSCLLVVGTSMQTAFAVFLVWLAEQRGMEVHFINDNADKEVPKFLLENIFLPVN